jgi:hypothetical protein
LGVGIENAHSVYLIVEEFDSQGVASRTFFTVGTLEISVWRIYVNDAAALGKLTRHLNHVNSRISCRHKLFGRGKIVEEVEPGKYRVNFPGLGLKIILADYLTME